jgi:hypothetical protein
MGGTVVVGFSGGRGLAQLQHIESGKLANRRASSGKNGAEGPYLLGFD